MPGDLRTTRGYSSNTGLAYFCGWIEKRRSDLSGVHSARTDNVETQTRDRSFCADTPRALSCRCHVASQRSSVLHFWRASSWGCRVDRRLRAVVWCSGEICRRRMSASARQKAVQARENTLPVRMRPAAGRVPYRSRHRRFQAFCPAKGDFKIVARTRITQAESSYSGPDSLMHPRNKTACGIRTRFHVQ